MSKTNPEAAVRFLAKVFKRSNGPVFICSLANDRSDSKRFPPGELITRERDAVKGFVAKWDQPGRALYFCVATLQPRAARRAKACLGELVLLHCDLDFKSIDAGAREIERAIRSPRLPVPSLIVFSGHGLHLYWLLKEALPATPENIGRVEAVLKRTADALAGDPAVCECSRLMRVPGTHNSKGGDWLDVRMVKQHERACTLEHIERQLAKIPKPLLRRLPGATRAKTHNAAPHISTDPFTALGETQAFVAPINVDERLAIMQHHGPGETSIHNTQLSVTAALLKRGYPIDEVVRRVMQATAIAAGREGASWNWRHEEGAVRAMCHSWLAKHPQIVFEI